MTDKRFDDTLAIANSGYTFEALGATFPRSTSTRLSDVVNVKDWGATGNGVTNDQPAINDAIAWLYAHSSALRTGATLFFPPGTYRIGSPPLYISDTVGGGGGSISLRGSGRDATIIKGNNDSGFIVTHPDSLPNIKDVTNLTIWNTSTTVYTGTGLSGALYIPYHDVFGRFQNLHLIGVIGLLMFHVTFNLVVANCIFECSIPLNSANAATVSPPAYTVGCFNLQGEIFNCRAIGFDTGFSLAQGIVTPGEGINSTGIVMYGCSAYRCNRGVATGDALYGETGGAGSNRTGTVGAGIMGCWFDRCGIAIDNPLGIGLYVAANVITNVEDTGVPDEVAISSITWSSNVATVHLSAAHNIASDQSILIKTSNHAFSPSGTGTDIVSITNRTSTTFDYSLPGSSPGSFSGTATWNYPLQYGVTCGNANQSIYACLYMPARVCQKSFDVTRPFVFNSSDSQVANLVFCTQAPYGWGQHPGDGTGVATYTPVNWSYKQCGTGGLPFLKFSIASLTASGSEFNIVDASSAGAFGAVVTGGGSAHIKMRNDGTNWIRVG